MSEEIHGEGAVGVDRRDFLRKSALVGGMVWAAPLIQSAPAFAQTLPTPTPIESPTPPPDCGPWSFLAVVLTCVAEDTGVISKYRVKYEYDKAAWEPDPGDAGVPECDEPTDWFTAEDKDGGLLGLKMLDVDTSCWKLFVPLVITNGTDKNCTPTSGTGKTGAPASPNFECGEFTFTNGQGEPATIDGVDGKLYEFCRDCD